MKFNGIKKIILLGIILLIVAGMVVVALKGFNVSLTLKQHELLNLYIGKEVNLKDVKDICKDVFKNKNFELRKLELFNDSVNICVESITNEEKQELVNKVNEKYATDFNVDGLTIETNSNIRLRDLVKPYIKPVIISVVLMAVYLVVRFRKMNLIKLLGNIIGLILITEAVLASVISIVRLPLSPLMINLMTVVAIAELIFYINKMEINYKKLNENE